MHCIELPLKIGQHIKTLFNTDYEVAIWFLAQKVDEKLKVKRMIHSPPDREKNVSPLNISLQELEELVQITKQDSAYELITGHMHSRTYGRQIEIFDPYWTVTVNDGDFSPGQIVDGRFYVSKKYQIGQQGGDSHSLRGLVEFGKAKGIPLTKHIFVHPKYGSEGNMMTPELVNIDAYELDQTQRFGVRELSVLLRHNSKSE
ncbi:MAG: hypothetical protein ABIH82_03200 [Candidatus Woesearchaeota archaeon]